MLVAGAKPPAAMVQVMVPPATGAAGRQLTPAAGVTTMLLMFAGRVSVKVTMPVLAPVPVLLAVMVHNTVSPTAAVVLSTALVTTMFGVTVVLVQSAGKIHVGLSGPLGTTTLV